ncbi:MAG: hypothetical protein GF401_00970 [Chitinivibrionales bacterium]|nr:hypothetical protein [Chitinivibrionales bacterium]
MLQKIVLMLCLTIMWAHGSPRAVAGTMLGKKLWWETADISYDTLGWDAIEKAREIDDSMQRRGPYESCEKFAAKGKVFFRVKELSALSVAILKDLGFEILFLVQYRGFTESDLMISVPGSSKDYKQRLMRSDYLWEKLEDFNLEKPEKMDDNYTVTLNFHEGGFSKYTGKEDIMNNAKQIVSGKSGVIIENRHDTGGENVLVRRIVYSVFMIADKKMTGKKIISKVEKVMDSLGLDLSYKPPHLEKIECP